jgi:uncharacterized protein YsxB (DUF464 family)
MIKVKYELKGDRYHSINVSGHAQYADKGQDLFCSAVSSIMFGLMNALDELNEDVEIKQLTNKIIVVDNSDSQIVKNYFDLTMYQLKTIEESPSNKGFIKVERK